MSRTSVSAALLLGLLVGVSACGGVEDPSTLDDETGDTSALDESAQEQAVVANLTSSTDCNASGNFAQTSYGNAWAWNASTNQWYGLAISSPIDLVVGSCGNFAVVSSGLAYAWNKTTNQWSG